MSTKIKVGIILLLILWTYGIKIDKTKSYYMLLSCYELWEYWVYNPDGTCGCKAWYDAVATDKGRLVCRKITNTCEDVYGKNAIKRPDGTCACGEGYIFYSDKFWNNSCIEGKSFCETEYWKLWVYDKKSNTCECSVGSELTFWYTASTYECKACGNNSTYNYSTKTCDCDAWYTRSANNCVKQENISFYHLDSFNNNNVIKVIDYKTLKAYEIKFLNINNIYKIKDFVGEAITINTWYNTSIDKWDKILLWNKNKRDSINTTVTSVKEINYKYNNLSCRSLYWEFGKLWKWNTCECKEWYILDSDGMECVWKSIKTYDSYNIYDSNSINSIFDTSKIYRLNK